MENKPTTGTQAVVCASDASNCAKALSPSIHWHRLCLQWLHRGLLGLLGLLVGSMSLPAGAQSYLAAGEVPGAGQLYLASDQGEQRPALNQTSKVHFAISGLVAQVDLEQTFINSSDEWVHGVYVFPLPDDAAVNHLEMQVADRLVLGEIREREEARQIFRDAVESGKKASLVEQQRPNLFTNRLANIGPGEAVTVRLRYVQRVAWRAGEFSLRFPMTLTARYIPGNALETSAEAELTADAALGWALPTDQVPDGGQITPFQHVVTGTDQTPLNPITVTAELEVGIPLASVDAAYHELAITRAQGRYRLALQPGVVEMDRDFVLSWQPVASAGPSAAWFSEEVEGQYYGLLMVVPPSPNRPGAGQTLPRELIFVVDTSGSMAGVPIAQARDALAQALRNLGPRDSFNIISFNDQSSALFPNSMPATRHFVSRALKHVGQLQAGGGTEMMSALELATTGGNDAGIAHAVRQVVFITDGAVGNEEALFEAIRQRLGDDRLFTVGIGSAPNSWFMRKAAQFGRGTFTAIGDVAEVQSKMAALFGSIASPLATAIQVTWPAGADAETYPRRIPDLYAGEPLVLSASFGTAPPLGTVEISGLSASAPWSRRIDLSPAADAAHPGVGSVWARRKIEHLLDLRFNGVDESIVRQQVLEVALPHAMLSPYSSFVAVEQRLSRPPRVGADFEPVPNSRPNGQARRQIIGYPIGATGVTGRLLLGALCLFIAMMMYVMRQEEVDHVPAVA